MKRIKLTQGQFALVDDEDFKELSKHKWHAQRSQRQGWFVAVRGRVPAILMHRQIMQPPNNLGIDHENHNTLDNRKCNLRIATATQNNRNRRGWRHSSSPYKGVSWNKQAKKWRCRIMVARKSNMLGDFAVAIDAAKAYDEAARKYFGEFAWLNFK